MHCTPGSHTTHSRGTQLMLVKLVKKLVTALNLLGDFQMGSCLHLTSQNVIHAQCAIQAQVVGTSPPGACSYNVVIITLKQTCSLPYNHQTQSVLSASSGLLYAELLTARQSSTSLHCFHTHKLCPALSLGRHTVLQNCMHTIVAMLSVACSFTQRDCQCMQTCAAISSALCIF